MASTLTNAAKNAMLNGASLAGVVGFVSGHTADPGTTGINEITGGSPTYARKAVTWAAAAGGSVATNNSPVFDVPPGTTMAFVGMWSAASGGTFYGSWDVVDEVFAGQGTYTFSPSTVTLP